MLSARRLFVAPHRLMFFIGACNVLLAVIWWTAWLIAMRMGFVFPQPNVPAGWLHAFFMQYQVLPSFFFGFLLTTFPKWTGVPEIPRSRFVPVGMGMMGGQAATLAGAVGVPYALQAGAALTVIGWSAGMAALGGCLVREQGVTWHARLCFAGLVSGFAGLLCWCAFVSGLAPPHFATISISTGAFGLLLPVYLTVAHRMFPFFAANAMVSTGYRPWRPMWLLGLAWALMLAHLALELFGQPALLWVVDAPLLVLSATMLIRWWPAGKKPLILTVLFAGFAWLPLTFGLLTLQSWVMHDSGRLILGHAPLHALFIGFFGSILVAMVTRVSQGHSGRPLLMPPVALYAFLAINVTAVVRVVADVVPDPAALHAAAGALWLVSLAPWLARLARIYLAPRADGKEG